MLQGKLVCLRAFEGGDVDQYYNWINEPKLARLILGGVTPFPKEGIIKMYNSYIRSPRHDIFLAIVTLSKREPIGFCFLQNIHSFHRVAELEQFFIGEKRFRNNGYGKDALVTLLKYCFTELNLNRIWLITYSYNKEAIEFYEKTGFLKEGILRQVQFTNGNYQDGVIMAILKKDWEEKNQFEGGAHGD